VLRGESLLLLGIAGTGKTYRAQGIVERLRHSGKRVDVISTTHTASRRAGGATADNWVRRHVLHGSASCDFLWIDEFSQIDIGPLNQIAKLHWAGVQFLLSGDFHQFAPIGNNWRGSPVGAECPLAHDGWMEPVPTDRMPPWRQEAVRLLLIPHLHAPSDAVFLEVSGRRARGNGAQSMLLWPGIQLYGCTSAAQAVRN
jgi:hypothetical protein